MELDYQNEETFSAKYSQIFSYILLLIGLIFLYYGSKHFISVDPFGEDVGCFC